MLHAVHSSVLFVKRKKNTIKVDTQLKVKTIKGKVKHSRLLTLISHKDTIIHHFSGWFSHQALAFKSFSVITLLCTQSPIVVSWSEQLACSTIFKAFFCIRYLGRVLTLTVCKIGLSLLHKCCHAFFTILLQGSKHTHTIQI